MKPLALVAALAISLAGGPAAASGYPAQPIRLVVPFGAGGVTDTTARVFAEGLSKELGQPVVVENRAGAGGAIAASSVAKSRPDGYTLLVITNGMYAVNPLIYAQLPYDPDKDFDYVAMLANTPTILAVGPDSPHQTLTELVEAAKARPESLSFSTAGEGSDNYQVMRLLEQASGARLLHVPYKSGPESLTAMMSRQTDATAVSAVTAGGFIAANQIRPLAVTSSRRLAQQPQVPTAQEALGRPIEGGSLSGIAAPAGTPEPVLERLNAAIAAVAAGPLAQQKVYAQGSEPVDPGRRVFEQRVREEQAKWRALLKPADAR
ncbi:ABC transporter substrate-binding protein [Bordetella trematum]|uniref:Putattive exported protein n=1 Tax=Bordetella trematum TaxID=123899 RepID=A0A157SN79_9BORD|nr:tripartite tricarboxylate transporter substrate binding protein [Bordetella trematum]AUL47000.1 ABC transporter substrate-binding protein [Bordetella trematum]AZR93799.1 ABC transporter substrate-binding protein [Bordetella trematum]NNH20983.1 tripartite tricarboxylate transporter substrate binding protein [Bordetella trematum]QIM72381.1 tripartite tricarboxylate transporter substrate binding protein [Bordetella trematum]SAI39421.1 putattive exported protein [Bordetella trematum]